MNFYNILWLTIFSLGGITLGIFGLSDLTQLTLLIINPEVINKIIHETEKIYVISLRREQLPVLLSIEPN